MSTGISFVKVLPEYLAYLRGLTCRFPSHHREDLEQEGRIGLFRACETYDRSKGVPFDAYAKACIRNRILTAYRRLKKDDVTEKLNEEILTGEDPGHAEAVKAFFDELRRSLTELECRVLDEYLADRKYSEIAQTLQISVKQVDNALSRIKRKIRLRYGEY